MKTILITGSTGALGHVVLPRLQQEGRCIELRRNDDPSSITDDVDAIVHLAGGFAMGGSLDDFNRMLDANLLYAVKTIGALTPRLRDGGRIVAISSIASLATPAGIAAYAASKAALNAYIAVLAKELAERRITANAIAPSTLDERLRASVAETIVFLLSDAAGAMTGQVLSLL